MRIVYRAANIIDANLVKAALEQAGMLAFVNGEYLTGGIGQLPTSDLVTVMVADADIELATRIAAEIDELLQDTSSMPMDVDDPLPTPGTG